MREVMLLASTLAAVVLAGSSAAARPDPAKTPEARTWEWRQAATLGDAPTWFSAAFTIGDMAYVGSGYGFGTAFWRYDPGRDTWTRRADFAGKARGAAVAFSIGGRGYVGLGYGDDVRFADLWEYDPTADRWTLKASLPAVVRDHAGAFVIGRKAYVVGGMTCAGNDCTDLKEVWEYDPRSDRWTKRADLPQTATTPASFVLDGRAYLVTGSWGGTPSKDLWEFDPQADRWTHKAGFPGPGRFRAVGFALGGRGYIATGIETMRETSAVVLKDVWEYTPKSDTWRRKPDFSGPARGAAVSFVVGSRVFIGTGVDSSRQVLRDFWQANAAPAEKRKAASR
jgi:N-acetylneuraminic acid mutarotase